MPGTVVIGAQFGDEGKGKLVDYLLSTGKFQTVVRFNGGGNAGHTVRVNDKTYKFHQLPSGVLQDDLVNIIGNGCVIDPAGLDKEFDDLEEAGISPELLISERAHVIMPWHPIIDQLEGQMRRGGLKESEKGSLVSSTTGKGIGPCYADKASRFGIRIGDLLNLNELKRKLDIVVPLKENYIEMLRSWSGQDPVEPAIFLVDELVEKLHTFAVTWQDGIIDTGSFLNNMLKEGKNVLFEGAQSAHLDTDLGVYPYSTSSICAASGASSGTGTSPKYLNEIIGIIKAYTSRSGDGAFPSEIRGAEAEELRKLGNEYGTTTGRPRRVGWLDLIMVKSVVEMNGVDSIALTRMDTLREYARSQGMNAIPVCVGYVTRDGVITHFPTIDKLSKAAPIYSPVSLDGYIDFIEKFLGVPVKFVGTGPGRENLEVR